jgi:hypothetical protein
MWTKSLTSLLVILLVNGLAPAQEPVLGPAPSHSFAVLHGDLLSVPVSVDPFALLQEPALRPPAYSDRFWAEGDVLLWWIQRANLPPLVTGSPPGTPLTSVGVPGTAGVSVLFGGSPVNGDVRVGGRVTAGVWLDCDHTCGVEAYFFDVGTQAHGFSGGLPGNLGRPFIDAVTGLPRAELVSFPGFLNGTVNASASSGSLAGAGALGRANLCCSCSYRLDALAGYRFLTFSDRVVIGENLTSTDLAQTVAPLGTNIIVTDSFRTANYFNGADLGLAGEVYWNNWTLRGTVRIGLGVTHEHADINGLTITTVPGFPSVTSPGGVLALSSNSGNHTRDMFAVAPEVRLQLGYEFGPHLRVYAGYSFLYWSQVARAGDQIDLAVNPALVPPPIPGASPLRPAFSFHGTGIWAQGFDLGLQFRF